MQLQQNRKLVFSFNISYHIDVYCEVLVLFGLEGADDSDLFIFKLLPFF